MAQERKKRESHYVTMARIAYDLAQATFPQYTHRNSPKTYTQWQLAACVLLMFYLGLSYRDMEEWLLATDQVCAVLELRAVPDHTTLYRMYQRMRMGHLEALNARLMAQLGVEEDAIAVDATGFSPTGASSHYRSRSGQTYRRFIKGFYAVGVESQFILAWRFDWGPDSDMPFLDPLRRSAHRYGRKCKGRREWILLADKGFDGAQARPTDLIPPRRGKQRIARPDRQIRAALIDMARLDGFWGQRWKCETVHSVIKRKSGEAIRSRQYWHQYREVAVKGLVYNIHR